MAESDKVLVETSVWIDFLGGEPSAVAGVNALGRSGRIMVCGQILQEVLQGSRDEKALAKLEKQMSVWDSAVEEPADFIAAARIFTHLRWKGVTLPPTDCLIAAVAVRRNLPLYTHDSDFNDVPQLQRYKP